MNKLTLFPLFFNFVIFIIFLLFGTPTKIIIGWIGPIEISFWIDQNFAIGAFIGIIIAMIGMGFGALGIGFSDQSIKLTLEITAFTAIWAMMSTFTLPTFNYIPFVGSIIWSILTISYASGVFLDIATEGREGG